METPSAPSSGLKPLTLFSTPATLLQTGPFHQRYQHQALYLFLTHFHLDHIIGLHTLNKFSFPRACHLWTGGSKELLAQFVNRPFTAAISALPPVEILELPDCLSKLPFPVRP
jgi:phosphoribosyl 1,2-cyclic phosphodiesterase